MAISVGALASSTSLPLSIPLPATVNEGDKLVTLFATRDDDGSSDPGTDPTTTIPSGYTAITSGRAIDQLGTVNFQVEIGLYEKTAGASESASSWDSSINRANRGVFGFTIAIPAAEWDAWDATAVPHVPGAGATTDYTHSGITTATDGATVLLYASCGNDVDIVLKSGSEQGFTALASGDDYDSTTGVDQAFFLGSKTITTAGAVTMPTVEGSATATYVGVALAYKPPSTGVTGTSAQTLAAFTSTASGTVTAPAVSGSGSPSLAAHTSTASGTSTAPAVTGSGAVTLDDAASAASGSVSLPAVTGSASLTLENHASTAAGSFTAPAVSGSAVVVLQDHDSTASGVVTAPAVSGSGAVTLEGHTSAASGAYSAAGVTGSATPTLADHISTASGSVTAPAVSGTVTVTLSDWTSTAAGTVTAPGISGTVTVTLDDAAATAAGTVTNTHGTATPTLDDHTSAATGSVTAPAVSGTVSAVLDDWEATATGTFAANVTGTSTQTLEDFTSAAAGSVAQPFWWETNPVAYAKTPTPVTRDPVGFTKIHGEDQSPW